MKRLVNQVQPKLSTLPKNIDTAAENGKIFEFPQ